MKTFLFTAATLFVMFAGILLFQPSWESIASYAGGEPTLVDEAQRPCYWYPKDQQLVCFNVFTGWMGKDAVPAYVIENGGFKPLYLDHARDPL